MLIIVILIIGFVIFVVSSWNTANECRVENERNGIVGTFGFTYIGGLNDEVGGSEGVSIFYDNKVSISINNGNLLEDFYKGRIISSSIESESQITQSVSLGKLLVFGALAFGMKKNETETFINYLVVKFKDSEYRERTMIIRPKNQSEIQKYNNLLNTYRAN